MTETPSPRPAEKQPAPDGGPRGQRAGPLTLRLVLALALFPIVPSGGLILAEGVMNLAASNTSLSLDTGQVWMFLITVATTLASLGIWRRTVAWSAGQYGGTVVATAVPMAQVIWWQPLWSGGCTPVEALRVGQSSALIGLWVWVTIWIWWGWSLAAPLVRGRLPMTDSAKRVLLSFGTLPLVVGGYAVTMIFLEESNLFSPPNEETKEFVCGNSIWVLAVSVVWLLTWRSVVLWSPAALAWTGGLALAFLGVGITAPLIPDDSSWLGTARFMFPVMAWGGWMILTMLIWRFRSKAVASVEESLRCRACGYSLRGLYATRCPECGDQPTLDELLIEMTAAGDA